MNITITDKAKEMLHKNNVGATKYLRIVITEGGCAGLTYGAEIIDKYEENERVVYEVDGIGIVSNDESIQYLEGLNIDYSDDLISGGLKFTSTQAGSTCSCGSSFGLAGFPVKEGGSCATVK